MLTLCIMFDVSQQIVFHHSRYIMGFFFFAFNYTGDHVIKYPLSKDLIYEQNHTRFPEESFYLKKYLQPQKGSNPQISEGNTHEPMISLYSIVQDFRMYRWHTGVCCTCDKMVSGPPFCHSVCMHIVVSQTRKLYSITVGPSVEVIVTFNRSRQNNRFSPKSHSHIFSTFFALFLIYCT